MHVLLVENNIVVAFAMKQSLCIADPGIEVQSVASVPQAMKAMAERLPDAIITGWNLEGGTAEYLVYTAKAFQIPIVIVTNTPEEDLAKFNVQVFPKPFIAGEVLILLFQQAAT